MIFLGLRILFFGLLWGGLPLLAFSEETFRETSRLSPFEAPLWQHIEVPQDLHEINQTWRMGLEIEFYQPDAIEKILPFFDWKALRNRLALNQDSAVHHQRALRLLDKLLDWQRELESEQTELPLADSARNVFWPLFLESFTEALLDGSIPWEQAPLLESLPSPWRDFWGRMTWSREPRTKPQEGKKMFTLELRHKTPPEHDLHVSWQDGLQWARLMNVERALEEGPRFQTRTLGNLSGRMGVQINFSPKEPCAPDAKDPTYKLATNTKLYELLAPLEHALRGSVQIWTQENSPIMDHSIARIRGAAQNGDLRTEVRYRAAGFTDTIKTWHKLHVDRHQTTAFFNERVLEWTRKPHFFEQIKKILSTPYGYTGLLYWWRRALVMGLDLSPLKKALGSRHWSQWTLNELQYMVRLEEFNVLSERQYLEISQTQDLPLWLRGLGRSRYIQKKSKRLFQTVLEANRQNPVWVALFKEVQGAGLEGDDDSLLHLSLEGTLGLLATLTHERRMLIPENLQLQILNHFLACLRRIKRQLKSRHDPVLPNYNIALEIFRTLSIWSSQFYSPRSRAFLNREADLLREFESCTQASTQWLSYEYWSFPRHRQGPPTSTLVRLRSVIGASCSRLQLAQRTTAPLTPSELDSFDQTQRRSMRTLWNCFPTSADALSSFIARDDLAFAFSENWDEPWVQEILVKMARFSFQGLNYVGGDLARAAFYNHATHIEPRLATRLAQESVLHIDSENAVSMFSLMYRLYEVGTLSEKDWTSFLDATRSHDHSKIRELSDTMRHDPSIDHLIGRQCDGALSAVPSSS